MHHPFALLLICILGLLSLEARSRSGPDQGARRPSAQTPSHLAAALLTRTTIRELTTRLDEAKGEIECDAAEGSGEAVKGSGALELGAQKDAQLPMSGGRPLRRLVAVGERCTDDARDEVEADITAALRMLCSWLLQELERPYVSRVFYSVSLADDDSETSDSSLSSLSSGGRHNTVACRVARREFHAFLSSTIHLLHTIQELQLQYRWTAVADGSGLFDALTWLQGLWASRSTNRLHLSFIEQQLAWYQETGCFERDLNGEILKPNVEIVEFVNDLIDLF